MPTLSIAFVDGGEVAVRFTRANEVRLGDAIEALATCARELIDKSVDDDSERWAASIEFVEMFLGD